MKIRTYRCDPEWIKNIQTLQESKGIHEVNCWAPGNQQTHLEEGSLFLFNPGPTGKYIVGGGIFCHSEKNISYSEAWNSYGIANGVCSKKELREMAKRTKSYNRKFIASQVIRQPFFLKKEDWIKFPKKLTQNSRIDLDLNEPHIEKLWKIIMKKASDAGDYKFMSGYGKPTLMPLRKGQREFRKCVLKMFDNKCAVTGVNVEKVLEAAHIIPYAEEPYHDISNGVALRADIHKLFDSGYATIIKNGKKFQFVICDKFWKDFKSRSNREEYMKWHGKDIRNPRGWNLKEEALARHHKIHNKLLGNISKLVKN